MSNFFQQPIPTKFGFNTTASDVLEGIDLSGSTAVVTGGYSGIGLATVKSLVAAGAKVVVAARNPAKAAIALNGLNSKIEIFTLRLDDLATVDAFVENFKSNNERLDVLINNAAVYIGEQPYLNNGWDIHMAVNYLGHFALTRQLTDVLMSSTPARVINVSCAAHLHEPIRRSDIVYAESRYDAMTAYAQSKTAMSLFSRALNTRLREHGVMAFTAQPGLTKTAITRHMSVDELLEFEWMRVEIGASSGFERRPFKTIEQSAATILWCATSPTLYRYGGQYCEDCNFAEVVEPGNVGFKGVAPYAISEVEAHHLWHQTEMLLDR